MPTVTTTDDVVDPNDGALSLREALQQGGGAIDFAPFVQSGTIVLKLGQLEFDGQATIDGGIGGVTIDGNHQSRVLSLNGNVALNNLTITNGYSTDGGGGGIGMISGNLSVANCTITGNVVDTAGVVTGGGGLGTGAPAVLTNCTISGNSIVGDGVGGGVGTTTSITLDHCTVTGNYADGGGGLSAFPQPGVTLIDTIIVGNGSTSDAIADLNVFGDYTSNGHNLFGDVFKVEPGDLKNVPASLIFADKAPVDHGGPTPTIALLDQASNPAVAHGGAGPAADQRGAPRPAPGDTNPDIGAFELRQTFSAVQGSVRNDRLHGAAIADDHLLGGRGDDRLFGHGGGDRLEGGAGADRLFGGRDTDLLYGGAGADRLFGGKAGDLLHGGAGADRFIFVGAGDSPPRGMHDLILDFSRAGGDRIDLRQLDGDPDRAGNQRLEFIGDRPFTDAGQVRAVIAHGQTLVEVNLDHDHRAELAIDLAGSVQLHARDFLL